MLIYAVYIETNDIHHEQNHFFMPLASPFSENERIGTGEADGFNAVCIPRCFRYQSMVITRPSSFP